MQRLRLVSIVFHSVFEVDTIDVTIVGIWLSCEPVNMLKRYFLLGIPQWDGALTPQLLDGEIRCW